jgi:hypothetical protein
MSMPLLTTAVRPVASVKGVRDGSARYPAARYPAARRDRPPVARSTAMQWSST